MKNYLDLIPVSQKIHRKQSRMARLCIGLSVFLITAIFGMADMEIRSQNAQAKINYGEWHAGLGGVSDEEAELIGRRPKTLACTRYDTLNYRLSMHYQVAGKEAIIIGFDEEALDIFPAAHLEEGRFPQEEGGVIVDRNMQKALSLNLGDGIVLSVPDGTERTYHITGFFGQMPMLAKKDVFGLAMRTEEFRKLPLEGAEGNHDSFVYVKFSPWCNIQREIRELQELFRIPDERVSRNELLLATIGQSKDVSMLAIYGVALLLAFLVAVAGVLMITGSLNSNIVQRTEFFGMLRCLGASKGQVARFVRREALYWCRTAVPAGAGLGMAVVWALSAVLRFLSPAYFGGMPYFGISFIGLAAGSVIGVATVSFAAGSPARKAAGVSPLTAVSGNASGRTRMKKAANTRMYRIETALGIHHALGSRKNFVLMSCSFAFSIILFLAFSVAVDFMEHAVKPLKPYAPDISVISPDNSCSIDRALAEALMGLDGVKRVYGRSFAYDLQINTEGGARQAYLVSYEACQFGWAKDSLIEGSLADVMEGDGILAVYHGEDSLRAGQEAVMVLDRDRSVGMGSGEEERQITVSGVLSDCPFHSAGGEEILICSEETFEALAGGKDYTVIDIQLERDAGDGTVEGIRSLCGEEMIFSDSRLSNAEVKGAMYSFRIFVYGFLGVIALICAFHITNSIAMSVSARMSQYGAMRAVGMDGGQMVKMVAAEAAAYGVWGMLFGCLAGVPLHYVCFDKMITYRWGTGWYFPAVSLCVIGAVVACSLVFAVYGPVKRIRELSVVDAVSGR